MYFHITVPSFGMLWIFAVLLHIFPYLTFEYLFVIVWTLQGLGLFFSCCYMDDDIRAQFLTCKKKARRLTVNKKKKEEGILLEERYVPKNTSRQYPRNWFTYF